MPLTEEIKGKALLIAEEIILNKYLASNDSNVRKRGISGIKKWLKKISVTNDVTIEDYTRIWTGLFYYFWMSDMPLVQEAAAERISALIHHLDTTESIKMFIRGFFITLGKNYDAISSHRTDKFLMLMRRFLRQILFTLRNGNWNMELLDGFSEEMFEAQQILPFSLVSHLNEIFNEEVAKVSKGNLTTDVVIGLMRGYVNCIATLKPNTKVVNNIQRFIFCDLFKQLKLCVRQKPFMDTVEEDAEDFSLNVNAEGSDDETNDSDLDTGNALDPRPGKVDVIIPYIDFDEKQFSCFLNGFCEKVSTPWKAKNILSQLINMLGSVSSMRTSAMKLKINNVDDKIKNKGAKVTPRRSMRSKTKIKKSSLRRIERSEEEIQRDLERMGDIIQIKTGKTSVIAVKKAAVSPVCICSKNVRNLLNAKKQLKYPVCTCHKKKNKKRPQNDCSKLKSDMMLKGEGLKLKPCKDNQFASLENLDDKENKDNESIEVVSINEADSSIKFQNNTINSTAVTCKEHKNLFVNFRSDVDVISYSCDDTNSDSNGSKIEETCSEETNEIIVPEFCIKGRDNMLKSHKKYASFKLKNIKEETGSVTDNRQIHMNMDCETNSTVLTNSCSEWTSVSPSTISELMMGGNGNVDDNSSKLAPQISVDKPVLQGLRSKRKKQTPHSVEIKKRKVAFTLQNNSFQELEEYKCSLQSKPRVPFDANKEPIKSALKPSPITTPYNPFYKIKSGCLAKECKGKKIIKKNNKKLNK